MSAVKKILVLRLGAMGDILFTTPALRGLKAKYPDSHLTYVLMKKWAFLLARNPCVDRVVGLRYRQPRAVRGLARESFDLLVNFYEFEDAAQICETLSAVERRGNRWIDGRLVCDDQSRWIAKDLDTQRELLRSGMCLPEVYCRIAGVEPAGCRPDFSPGRLARLRARLFLMRRGLDRPPAPIALHLHSRGSPAKSWNPASALQLVRRMPDQQFLVLGYKGDRPQTRDLEREPNAVVTYSDAPAQAAMLGACALFVGIDSGPRQLAVAMGTPTLTLFGPRPAGFVPHTPHDAGLSLRETCAPCFLENCPLGRCCLDQIPMDRIEQAVREVLSRNAAGVGQNLPCPPGAEKHA